MNFFQAIVLFRCSHLSTAVNRFLDHERGNVPNFMKILAPPTGISLGKGVRDAV